MSKQRIVKDSFWTDSYIEKLSPDEKLLFLYLITNPLCNIAGVYEIRSKRIGFDTGYDVEVVENILNRFEADGKIIRYGDYLIIKNFIKNQSVNPKVVAGIERILSELPKEVSNLLLGDVNIKSNQRSTKNFTKALERDGVCVECKSNKNLEVDHKIPLFNGGDNSLENLQTLCKSCHSKKTKEDFIAYGKSGGIGYRTLLNLTLPNSTLLNSTSASKDWFSIFWEAYPKKIGKGSAEKAWAKLKPDLAVVLSAIEAQKKSKQWSENDGKYIPHPTTWLNQKRWEDEVANITQTSKYSKYDT